MSLDIIDYVREYQVARAYARVISDENLARMLKLYEGDDHQSPIRDALVYEQERRANVRATLAGLHKLANDMRGGTA